MITGRDYLHRLCFVKTLLKKPNEKRVRQACQIMHDADGKIKILKKVIRTKLEELRNQKAESE